MRIPRIKRTVLCVGFHWITKNLSTFRFSSKQDQGSLECVQLQFLFCLFTEFSGAEEIID